MNRCSGCGSLRVIVTIDGDHGYCTRCRRRLSAEDIRPPFVRAVALGDRRSGDPDPHPAA
jgi:uncharacterized paraquat-inducible protein A